MYKLFLVLIILKYSRMKPEDIIIPKYYILNKLLAELKEIALNKNINLFIVEIYVRTIISIFLLFIPLMLMFMCFPL